MTASIASAIARTARLHGRTSISGGQSQRKTIPASIRGWNTRDALSEMKPEFAIRMENYFSELGVARLRQGATAHASGVGAAKVEAVFSHRSGATERLIAAGEGGIYDCTSPGAATSLGSGFASNRWQHASAGGQTILVNGEDAPQRVQADGTLAAHGWTGITTPSNLYRVLLFKHRLLFAEKDTAKLWYGGVDFIMGELSEFDLAFVAPGGGNILALGTFSIDAGSGPDDFLAIFMSSGAVIVYSGTDINDSDAFGIVGIWEIGRVVGDRPLTKFGGDLIAITTDGYIGMRTVIGGGREGADKLQLSDAISPSVSEAVRFYGSLSGWQGILHAPANWLLFNVPSGAPAQHVMNTQSGAWSRFTGMNAHSWGLHDDQLYFGGPDGTVNRADNGESDLGTAIEGDIQSAYNYFGTSREKRFKILRAFIESTGTVAFSLGCAVDFEEVAPLTVDSTIVGSGTKWNSAPWNSFKWGAGRVQKHDWGVIEKTGAALSVRLKTSTEGARISIASTDIDFEAINTFLEPHHLRRPR